MRRQTRLAPVVTPNGVYFELSGRQMCGGKETTRAVAGRSSERDGVNTVANSMLHNSKTPHWLLPILVITPGSTNQLGTASLAVSIQDRWSRLSRASRRNTFEPVPNNAGGCATTLHTGDLTNPGLEWQCTACPAARRDVRWFVASGEVPASARMMWVSMKAV
jgi:hypothetical protein